MSRFAPPRADPHGLRDAARRLTEVGRDLEGRGERVAATGTATLHAWQGSASLLMAARAHELHGVTQHSRQALGSMAQATDRYADEVDRVQAEVRRLNEQWDDAVRRAQHQAAAAAAAAAAAQREARLAAERAAAEGERFRQRSVRTVDDGSAELAQTQAELEQRYRRITEELEAEGFSLQRALSSGDPVSFLPTWMAGGVTLGQAAFKTGTTATKAARLARYVVLLRQVSQCFPLGKPVIANAVRSSAESRALMDVMKGKPSTVPVVGRGLTVAGRAFLPLTLFTGLVDVRTGGGHDDWRDPVTRVAGGAGALGAGAVILSGATGLFVLGPVGVAVAAGAVLAYGLWSVGNLVHDERQAIGDFFGRARDAAVSVAVDRAVTVVQTVEQAKDLAVAGATGVARAGGDAVDTGRKVLDVVTGPTRLLPKVAGLF